MDYFGGCGGETDSFSLQDMIESDMKTEFDDHLPHVSSANDDLNHIFASFPSSSSSVTLTSGAVVSSHLHGDQVGMASASHAVNELGGAASGAETVKLEDLEWLQTVSIPSKVMKTDIGENSDPNLLVNPQTGLPVGVQQQQQQSPPQALTIPKPITVIKQEDIVMMSPQPQITQIQVINRPTSTPASPMQPPSSPMVMSPMSPQVRSSTQGPSLMASSARRAIFTTAVINNSNQPLQSIQNTPQKGPVQPPSPLSTPTKKVISAPSPLQPTKVFPKPVYSYSCLIAMALKNSDTGALPVAEIYNFMTDNFPYFKTAPDGWKNSVRHNLSLNKCFKKIDNPRANGNTRKGCLWGLNPEKVEKMDEEIVKWRKKDPITVKRSMAKPDVLESLEKGNTGSQSPCHPNNVRSSVSQLCAGDRIVMEPTNISLTATTTIAPVSLANDVHLNMIEIVPHRPSIKTETTIKDEATDLNSDDLAIIDTALNLDPSLTDLNMQSHIWDDLDDTTSVLTTSSSNAASPLVSLLSNGAASSGVLGARALTPTSFASASRTLFAQT